MWRRIIIAEGQMRKQKMHYSGCHALQIGTMMVLSHVSHDEHNSVLENNCRGAYQEILGEKKEKEILGKSGILLSHKSNKGSAYGFYY